MNKLFLKLTLLIATTLVSVSALADLSSDLANICTIVKNNDKSELRKKLNKIKKDYSVRLGGYYKGITCGGNTLIRHSMASTAPDAGTYLIKQMRRADLKRPEQDGKTIAQWAEENGHIDSPIGVALLDRLN